MRVRQRFGQDIMDASVGVGDRLGTGTPDNIQRMQNDVSVPQRLEDSAGEHDAPVGMHSVVAWTGF